MNPRRLILLAVAALAVAGAAVWVSMRGGAEVAAHGQTAVLAGLAEAVDAVNEVRLTRGDGTTATLTRRDNGWVVAQRDYPADPAKLRRLLLGLSTLHLIEEKTSDPARYAALDVEDATGAQAHSVRVDVAAGTRTWSLLLGKSSGVNDGFVRVPGKAAAALAQPRIDAEPDPARWIDAQILDIATDQVQQVAVHPIGGPSYRLDRDKRGEPDLTLHGVPPGRKPAAPAVIDAIAGALARFNVEDVRARSSTGLDHPSQATFRTFDGLQIDVEGTREGNLTWIRVAASVDQDTAKRFSAAPPPAQASATGAAAEAKAGDGKAAPAAAPDPAAEAAAINSRLGGFDFQVPAYRYDEIYRQLKDLIAPETERLRKAQGK
jgi:uncharacterized protein DUF4340